MYTKIDVIGAAEAAAAVVIRADRERYRPFFEAAERLAVRDALIVCGPAAVQMLTSSGPAEVSIDDYHYDFYSSRGFMMARELADVVYDADPDGLGHYTTLVTNIPHQNWKIIVDGRPLFSVTALPPKARGGSAGPRRPARFEKNITIPVVRPELALLDLYRALCDPARLAEAPGLLEAEAALRAEFCARYPDPGPQRPEHARPIADMRRSVLANFVGGPGRALVCDRADQTDDAGPLRLISQGDFDTEAEEVAVIGRALGLAVGARAAELGLPGDPRMRRLTLSVVGERARTDLLEIYNTAQYELVPVVPTGGQKTSFIAAPFAALRALLADNWVARSASDTARAQRALHSFHRAARALDGPPDRVLPADTFIGRASDSDIAFKREVQAAFAAAAAASTPRFYSQYMPAAAAKAKRQQGLGAKIQAEFSPLPWED